jgi:type II secretion system (T2SS) protein E
MARKKLGEMLIEAGVLDEARLRSALADQRRWGRSLGKTLVEMKLIAEDELVRVLAQQLGLPSVQLDGLSIPLTVTDLLPDEVARQHQVIAFEQDGKFLHVAMVDPTNLGVTDELRIRTQLNIRPYLAGPRQIERALARYHGGKRRADSIEGGLSFDSPDMFDMPNTADRVRRPTMPGAAPGAAGIRAYPRTSPPPIATGARDAEIDALQHRISSLEALVARDEEVLRKVLALLIDKGVASRDEILERIS